LADGSHARQALAASRALRYLVPLQDRGSNRSGANTRMTAAPAEIRYLHESHPQGVETYQIAPGILWARLPLPFRLNHVNVWLLRDADGWTIIDTGVDTPAARAIWEGLLVGPLADAPVNRLIATHGHVDHVGLSGWLVDKAGGAEFVSTLGEWMAAQIRIWDARTSNSSEVEKFLASHGCDAATVTSYDADRRRTQSMLGSLPGTLTRLRDGDTIRFGERDWQVIAAGGHAIEHASFWCEEDRILIAGDQILSRISPMIGVFPAVPEADPLAEYLASLPRFKALPADALVLPSHGLPFHGLHARVDQLAHHHELRLDDLARLMDKPRVAMELAHGLFTRAVEEGQGRAALAETLAHANYLVGRGRAERTTAPDGRVFYSRARSSDSDLMTAN
jgi:glyoxylase-like metal-dependent hydrolase (beta-lactamase superfamily II)